MHLIRIALAMFFFASTAGTVEAERAPLSEHVVLISADGLRPEFYLEDGWPAPMLQQMAREGAYSEGVRGVFPSVTYPSHTTLITGLLPARHGIYYNSPFEPEGQSGRWYWEAEHLQAPTLWDLVREAGGVSAGVHWPVTVGAPIDYNLPEVWSLDPDVSQLEVIRRLAHPQGLVEELEREATGKLSGDVFHPRHILREDYIGAVGGYLLTRYRPSLMAIHIVTTDSQQHREGREGPLVRRAVAAADRAVSRMVETAENLGILDRTTFVITGDHGFFDIHTQVAPNVWLAEEGLMENRPDRGDWQATFHTAGGSAFLHLRNPDAGATTDRVRGLLDSLPPGQRRLFRIVEREELEAIGADPAVPLALAAAPGVSFTAAAGGDPIRSGVGGTHGHFPDHPYMETGLVLWGAGVRRGAVAHQVAIEDVALLVARLLGLELSDTDGVLREGLLAP